MIGMVRQKIRKFILFGPGIYYTDNRIVASTIVAICIVSIIAIFICFNLYRKNLKAKTRFSKYMIYLYDKLTIEAPLLFVIISVFLSINSMNRHIYFYDKFVFYDATLFVIAIIFS